MLGREAAPADVAGRAVRAVPRVDLCGSVRGPPAVPNAHFEQTYHVVVRHSRELTGDDYGTGHDVLVVRGLCLASFVDCSKRGSLRSLGRVAKSSKTIEHTGFRESANNLFLRE